MKIDSHHHLWNYDPEQYGWISEQMAVLRRDFSPTDLQQELRDAGIDAAVAVQAQQTIAETEWLLEQAGKNPVIAGVVGWVPLASDQVADDLDRLHQNELLKGIRHVVQDEPADDFILGDDFNRGVAKLAGFGLVYDILIYGKHLPATIPFVDRHPHQSFVLDHIAKPTIRGGQFDDTWARQMRELARRDNVVCKFSGVVTEVRDPEATIETIRPYWDVALEAFGPDRLLFGSDWPVCLLKISYGQWVEMVTELSAGLSPSEQEKFWGLNAAKAYGLSPRRPR
ncbi:Amidohydrolase [Rosistilla carotiformis]|uniref:Amidohydrolase n=1 Tax=Rosistilla carotiformis TaxID=2528017 RepID=A0A518JXQ5_9BACT|nr:amidohydrolase family protein [Rosistilla carotiformis]QDV70319.1 Amidohydrolase [Rosistilla carotiformis]